MMEPYKNSCDHCGALVPKELWTFDLRQCVVCESQECKDKQKGIFKEKMNEIVNGLLEGKIKL